MIPKVIMLRWYNESISVIIQHFFLVYVEREISSGVLSTKCHDYNKKTQSASICRSLYIIFHSFKTYYNICLMSSVLTVLLGIIFTYFVMKYKYGEFMWTIEYSFFHITMNNKWKVLYYRRCVFLSCFWLHIFRIIVEEIIYTFW